MFFIFKKQFSFRTTTFGLRNLSRLKYLEILITKLFYIYIMHVKNDNKVNSLILNSVWNENHQCYQQNSKSISIKFTADKTFFIDKLSSNVES